MGWKFGEFNILMGFEIWIREIKGKFSSPPTTLPPPKFQFFSWIKSLDCVFRSLPNTNLAKFQKTRSEVHIQGKIGILGGGRREISKLKNYLRSFKNTRWMWLKIRENVMCLISNLGIQLRTLKLLEAFVIYLSVARFKSLMYAVTHIKYCFYIQK
jgi:hypothetical protein